MKPCKGKFGSCPNIIDYGEKYCPECLPIEKNRNKIKASEYDKDRGSARARGYDAVWSRLRKMKLRMNPLCECVNCLSGERQIKTATVVHHIWPIETHPELRLVMSNLMSMARDCHEREEGRKR